MNKLDKTLFLITCPGDRHEDHIPKSVMPLYKIKGRVSILAYERLLEAVISEASRNKGGRYTLWETDVGFVQDEDRSNYPPEINEIIDRYLLTENISDSEWDDLLDGGYLYPQSFFPLKLNSENVCKIDYL
jgi:hypothetical protein